MQTESLTIDALMAKLAGVAGAALSLNFVKGSWPERLTMAISGSIASLYVSPFMSQKLGWSESFTGFMVGLFGMALAEVAWTTIKSTPIAEIWQSGINYIRSKLGG
jgi:hypothetical protein